MQGDLPDPQRTWILGDGKDDPPATGACDYGSLQFVGRYQLIEQLGSGSSGVVYRARHRQSGHLAAVKLTRIDALSAWQTRRFHKEAQIVGSLDHPNIVHVFDSGVHVDGQLHLPWIATELVDGQPFDPASGPSEQRLATLMTICDAIAHAHARGVVHRDLKPQNVLVGADGTPHVVDFGIAKDLRSGDPRNTGTGVWLGTPAYMAPEVANRGAKAASYASDVYSLGAMLFEVVAGTTPHDLSGLSPQQALRRVADELPRAPRKHNANLPRDLEAIVATATALEPEHRYGSAAALRDDLQRYLGGQRVSARQPSILADALRLARRHRSKAMTIAGTLLLMVAAGLASFLLWQRAAYAESQQDLAKQRAQGTAARLSEALAAITSYAAEQSEGTASNGRISEFLANTLDLLGAIDPEDRSRFSQRWHEAEAQLRETAGDVAVRNGDWQLAAVHRQRVLEIERARNAAASAPSRDLARAMVKLGDVRRAQRRLDEMAAIYADAHAIYVDRHSRQPDDEDAHDDLCWSLERMSFVDLEVEERTASGLQRIRDRLQLAREGARRWRDYRTHHNLAAAILRRIDNSRRYDPTWQPAPELAQRALDASEQAIAMQPTLRTLQILRVSAQRTLAAELWNAGSNRQSLQMMALACHTIDQMLYAAPTDHTYSRMAISAWYHWVDACRQLDDDPDDGLSRLERLALDARQNPSTSDLERIAQLLAACARPAAAARVRRRLP